MMPVSRGALHYRALQSLQLARVWCGIVEMSDSGAAETSTAPKRMNPACKPSMVTVPRPNIAMGEELRLIPLYEGNQIGHQPSHRVEAAQSDV